MAKRQSFVLNKYTLKDKCLDIHVRLKSLFILLIYRMNYILNIHASEVPHGHLSVLNVIRLVLPASIRSNSNQVLGL